MKAFMIFMGLFFPLWALAQNNSSTEGQMGKKKIEPLPIGNFSVPTITQLAPLISFGQLLIGEKALLPQWGGCYTKGQHDYSNIMTPNIIYGIRDDLDIALFAPFTPRSRSDSSNSSGIMDMLLQGEYAYYSKSYIDHVMTGSIVTNVQLPTGSDKKDPKTGNGSFTYFLGTTFAYMSYNWYAFASPGVNLTTTHDHGTKYGNSYLYQWGFARFIPQLSPKGWVFNVMVEFDGTYVAKDKIRGETDPDSGGNVIMMTPSIWISSSHWIFELGIGIPLLQSLNGSQDKIHYSIPYNFAFEFPF